MLRKTTPLYLLTLFILIGCKTSQITPTVSYTPIKASIDLVNVIDDKVEVTIDIDAIDQDSISYYIPKIVPGTYQNNNYGNYIEDFTAYDVNDNPIHVQKQGSNKWKINTARQLRKISYWVNDTFDNEHEHEIFSPTGTNLDKGKVFVLNLYAFVGYFDQLREKKYNIFIKHPAHLEASTSLEEIMPRDVTPNSTYDVDLFSFKRYADVADTPIMYSDLDRVFFTVKDMDILLSVYSPNKVHRAAKIMPEMERMIQAQKNFLGTINSTKKYSILLYLSSAKSNDARGYGALEHNTSTVVVLPESLSREKLNEALTDIVSHEFFHILTPLTLHSEEIRDFDYNNPKMSRHLWLYEGTTEYFSMLFQIRQGIIGKEEFYHRILEKIEASKKFDNTISFTEMSSNILRDPYKKNYGNVYEKGALLSMCLDIILREHSEGQMGVLDMVKDLSYQFGSENPFKDEQLFKIIKKIPLPVAVEFLENHVANNTPIDYEHYLNKVGLHFGTKEVPSSYFLYEQEPYIKGSEETKEVVFTSGVTYNNFLNNLGIQGGDVLLGINGKKYNVKNIYDLFGDSKKWKKGSEATFDIKRNGKEISLTTTVIDPKVETIIITQNPKATPQQIALLKSWIND